MPAGEAVAREFVARINRHDASALVALCSADHRFVDSLGNTLAGTEALQRAWTRYFALFPDYCVEIQHVVSAGDLVLMSGWASASLAAAGGRQAWRIPAAWRAQIGGCQVIEWQVYADNKPVYDLLARHAPGS